MCIVAWYLFWWVAARVNERETWPSVLWRQWLYSNPHLLCLKIQSGFLKKKDWFLICPTMPGAFVTQQVMAHFWKPTVFHDVDEFSTLTDPLVCFHRTLCPGNFILSEYTVYIVSLLHPVFTECCTQQTVFKFWKALDFANQIIRLFFNRISPPSFLFSPLELGYSSVNHTAWLVISEIYLNYVWPS